jgi:hypothetical protein
MLVSGLRSRHGCLWGMQFLVGTGTCRKRIFSHSEVRPAMNCVRAESFVTVSNGAELLAISALASTSAIRVQDIPKVLSHFSPSREK